MKFKENKSKIAILFSVFMLLSLVSASMISLNTNYQMDLSSPRSADDGYEDNDTFETAYELTKPSEVEMLSFTVLQGDDDWFKMYLAEGENTSIYVLYLNDDVSVEFYFNSESTIVPNTLSNNESAMMWCYDCQAGYYYFKISISTGAIDASIMLIPMDSDIFGENDVLLDAIELYNSDSYDMVNIDPDFYKVGAIGQTAITITIYTFQMFDFTMAMTDSNGISLIFTEIDESGDNVLNVRRYEVNASDYISEAGDMKILKTDLFHSDNLTDFPKDK